MGGVSDGIHTCNITVVARRSTLLSRGLAHGIATPVRIDSELLGWRTDGAVSVYVTNQTHVILDINRYFTL